MKGWIKRNKNQGGYSVMETLEGKGRTESQISLSTGSPWSSSDLSFTSRTLGSGHRCPVGVCPLLSAFPPHPTPGHETSEHSSRQGWWHQALWLWVGFTELPSVLLLQGALDYPKPHVRTRAGDWPKVLCLLWFRLSHMLTGSKWSGFIFF